MTCLVNVFPFTSDPLNKLLGTGQKKGNCVHWVVVCGPDLSLRHALQCLWWRERHKSATLINKGRQTSFMPYCIPPITLFPFAPNTKERVYRIPVWAEGMCQRPTLRTQAWGLVLHCCESPKECPSCKLLFNLSIAIGHHRNPNGCEVIEAFAVHCLHENIASLSLIRELLSLQTFLS